MRLIMKHFSTRGDQDGEASQDVSMMAVTVGSMLEMGGEKDSELINRHHALLRYRVLRVKYYRHLYYMIDTWLHHLDCASFIYYILESI